MIFIIILFVVLVGGGWIIGKGIGKALFPDEKETYIDKSVHYHTTIVNNKHEHQHISIIDDVTKKEIFKLKESKEK